MTGKTALAAYRAFQAAHAAHGALLVSADEPNAAGYQVWAACPCGGGWERQVSLDEVLAAAHKDQVGRTQHGP